VLTIGYITNRKENHFDWFIDSLALQIQPGDKIAVVAVDAHAEHTVLIPSGVEEIRELIYAPPKPNLWQGKHRLTKENWFAASNARNTALCYALDGWIAYVDDLSVLMPGWLDGVRRAMRDNYIMLGSYRKVKNLSVDNGVVKSFDDYPQGHDNRWGQSSGDLYSCGGNWLYGCSCAMPVQALLDINGWPEALCDGLGFEDVCCGIALGNTGKYSFRYDRCSITLESEEDHHKEPAFRREDWHFEGGVPKLGGNGHDDKSHAALNTAMQSKYFPQYFGDGFEDIASLRKYILGGGQFPVRHHPDRDWYAKLLLSEL
jgi:glycosyltransferase involved in cell wall biosynthesis